MRVVVNRRAAAVKADFSLTQRFEKLLTASQSVEKGENHVYSVQEKRKIGNEEGGQDELANKKLFFIRQYFFTFLMQFRHIIS